MPNVALDLRSDAVTRATDAMWDAMRASDGRADAVAELEAAAAQLAGKPAALYVPTGTIGNLAALMSHTHHGEQVVVEASCHIRWSEEWGFAAICGVALLPLAGWRGHIGAGDLEETFADAPFGHRPATTLVCIENAHNMAGGTVAPVADVMRLRDVAHRHGARVHLDGARVLNACAALAVEPADMLAAVDSCTLNLNKGLSAPQGAVLVGSRDLVAAARSNVRRLGAHRIAQDASQAAAGLVGLRTMVPQLAEDNRRARCLAELLAGIEGVRVDVQAVETNIVMADTTALGVTAVELTHWLAARGAHSLPYTRDVTRFVTHRHISDGTVRRTAELVAELAATRRGVRVHA